MEVIIDSFRGEDFTLTGAITKNDEGYPDPLIAGTALVFVAKRNANDETPVIRHDLDDGNLSLASGGIYSLHIVAADTSDFTRSELLSWALWLIEPDEDGVVVAQGRWRIALAPGP